MADLPEPRGLNDEQLLQAVVDACKPGTDEHRNRIKRYDQAFDIWRAKPPASDKSLDEWRSRVRVPYAQGMIDTEVANICAGQPRCIVHPRRPDSVRGAVALQHLFDFYVSEDHTAEKQPVAAQQALVFGTHVGKDHWGYLETTRKKRSYQPDPMTGQLVEVVTDEPIVLRDGPCHTPWSVYDAWWDPNGRDVDSCAYVVLRSYLTRRQLQENAYNAETGGGKYRNLDKLFKSGPPPRRPTTAQEMFLGGEDAKRKDAFEIWEVWSDDALVVIGNQQVILWSGPNPNWTRKKNIVIAQTRPDLFEIDGIPETDLVRDIQDASWTLQNMTLDSLKLTVLRGATVRASSVADVNGLDLRPNFRWLVSDHDDVRAFEVPQLGTDVFTERTRLLGDMERVTGVSAYLSGADSGTVNQTTATGVSTLAAAANTLVRFKAQQLHNKVFQRMFEHWGDMIHQYLDHDIYVKITGEKSIQQAQQAGIPMEPGDEENEAWAQVGPQDVLGGQYRYRLEGSEESLSKQQERNDALGLLNALAPYAAQGLVNPKPLLERVALAFDVLDPSSLIPVQQPALPMGGNGNQPPQAPQMASLLNGAGLGSAQQNAISLRPGG